MIIPQDTSIARLRYFLCLLFLQIFLHGFAQRPASIALEIEQMSDKQYPDNPDIGFRSVDYKTHWFESGHMIYLGGDTTAQLTFTGTDGNEIIISDFHLMEYIPTVPLHLRHDPYLSLVALVNQEWNRNQVTLSKRHFRSTDPLIVRVDIARNCLQSYLWEIALYRFEEGDTVIYAHAWFQFPERIYRSLFSRRNEVSFEKYASFLEHWQDVSSHEIPLPALGDFGNTLSLSCIDRSDAMYPLSGARKKKRKAVLHPQSFETMRELQTDSTRFATFSAPGYYNSKEPRSTELGRFAHMLSGDMFSREDKKTAGIRLLFSDKADRRRTLFILDGVDLTTLPVLSPKEANKGWKYPVGIGNHTFYETYKEQLTHSSKYSEMYSLLLTQDGRYLDSHMIGIDGSLLHFDDQNPKMLHLWLLSFERHALVGHYIFLMK